MDPQRQKRNERIEQARKALLTAMENDVVMRGWRKEERALTLALDDLRRYDDETRDRTFEEYTKLQQALLERHMEIAGEQSRLFRLHNMLLVALIAVICIGTGIILKYAQPDPNVARNLNAIAQAVEKSHQPPGEPINVTLENLPPAPFVACTVTMPPDEKKKRGR